MRRGIMRWMAALPLVLAAAMLLAACSTAPPGKSIAANNGKYYSVTSPEAEFFHYGPQQGSGPDQKLPHDTLLTLIRPSFGYCKVQLLNGEQGYIASEDIHSASPQLIAAVTAPPPEALAPRMRLSPNDPRLIVPPEPLPLDVPEPETSPTP